MDTNKITKETNEKDIVNIKFLFHGYTTSNDDISQLYSNLYTEYNEYKMKEEKYSWEDGELLILWVGTVEKEKFDEEEFIRLTHHAEGLYSNTGIQHVHVEVCIEDKWYN